MLGRFARTRPHASVPGGLLRFFKVAPVLALMVLAFGFSDIAAISSIPLYVVRTGHSESFAALVVTMVALPTALAQPVVGWLLDHAPRQVIAVSSAVACGLSFLVLPWLTGEPALLVTVSVLGAASFSLYTCALTLLGERFQGGLLVAGSAAYALAYAIGSAAGSSSTGIAMDLVSVHAGPLSTGVLMLGFALVFAIGLARPKPAA